MRTGYGRLPGSRPAYSAMPRRSRTARACASQSPLVTGRARQPEQRAEEPRAGLGLGADHHVLQHRHPVEEPDALERAGDPEPGEVVRPEAAERRGPARRSSPVVGAGEPAGDVEQGGLAGAVGADHAVHPVLGHRQRDVATARSGPRRSPSRPGAPASLRVAAAAVRRVESRRTSEGPRSSVMCHHLGARAQNTHWAASTKCLGARAAIAALESGQHCAESANLLSCARPKRRPTPQLRAERARRPGGCCCPTPTRSRTHLRAALRARRGDLRPQRPELRADVRDSTRVHIRRGLEVLSETGVPGGADTSSSGARPDASGRVRACRWSWCSAPTPWARASCGRRWSRSRAEPGVDEPSCSRPARRCGRRSTCRTP